MLIANVLEVLLPATVVAKAYTNTSAAVQSSAETGIKAIAIAARDHGVEVDENVTPCGACRQVMAEIVQRYKVDFDVIMIGKKRTILIKASQLLPFSFVMP